MHGRTIILVSHHIQLCAPGAKYIVALDNGRVQFEGSQNAFYASGVLTGLLQSGSNNAPEELVEPQLPEVERILDAKASSSESIVIAPSESPTAEPKMARKLIEEEKRSVGRIGKEVWKAYLGACGKNWYWILFVLIFVLATFGPFGEKGWVTCVFFHIYVLHLELISIETDTGLVLRYVAVNRNRLSGILKSMPL